MRTTPLPTEAVSRAEAMVATAPAPTKPVSTIATYLRVARVIGFMAAVFPRHLRTGSGWCEGRVVELHGRRGARGSQSATAGLPRDVGREQQEDRIDRRGALDGDPHRPVRAAVLQHRQLARAVAQVVERAEQADPPLQ